MAINSDLIMDIGMNNGDDTAYYLRKGYRVVAVDAHPGMIENARSRFRRELEENRLILVNKGIAPERGSLTFWVCDGHSEWSSFNREIAARDGQPHHPIEVETLPLSDLLAEYGIPHYIKIDIEGYDRYCLESLDPSRLPAYISVEASTSDLLDRLDELGYRSFKCISQFNFLPLENPPSSEERRFRFIQKLIWSHRFVVRLARKLIGEARLQGMLDRHRYDRDWKFEPGSSGPFGEATPGRWQTHGEIKQVFHDSRDRMRRGEWSPFWMTQGYSFWVDFHAKIDQAR
jgi:FkbM family methyltransferase